MVTGVLRADDPQLVRQGLRFLLKPDPEVEIVGEATDGTETVHLARQLRPDLERRVLRMPGLAATAAIRREMSEAQVLALSGVLEDRADVVACAPA